MRAVTVSGVPTLDEAVAHVRARQESSPDLHAVQRLLALREHSPFALQTLADICESDEQQANRLRIASAHYAGRRLVTIRDALREHGYRQVYCVSLVGFLASAVDPPLRAPGHAGWWRRAVRLGVITQAVAGGTSAHFDLAFPTGLVSDLGDLLLTTYFPDLHAEALRFGPGAAHERAAWGYTRQDLAAALVSCWGFPQEAVDAVAGRLATRGGAGAPPSLGLCVERAHRLDRRYLEHNMSPRTAAELFADEPLLVAYLEQHGGLHWLQVLSENVLETAFVDESQVVDRVA